MMSSLRDIIPKLANQRILVLGDLILDEYIIGQAERMSREAPIPVLEFQSRRYIPGGAANPASNIVALGSTAIEIGIVGQDESARHLINSLRERGMEPVGLVVVKDRPTTLKTRIMAQMGLRFPQQVARIDTLMRTPITPDIENQVISQIERFLPNTSAILFSDYHNGLLTAGVIQQTQQMATQANVPLFVDAQGQLQKYSGLDWVKCNADDAEAYLGHELRTDSDFAMAAQELLQALKVRDAMVITRGSDGATVAQVAGAVQHCPAPKVRDVFDTVGAGDTAIAVMTLARVAGASPHEAVMLANYASGIVVQHVGNYAPSPKQLLAALEA